MPFYRRLKARLKADADWGARYRRNLPAARRLAERVPLIHVCARKERTSFDELFERDPPALPTSADKGYYSEATRESEQGAALGQCGYFYAGHAVDEFGEVALGFDPVVERTHTGSATPFDTGGLMGKPPRCINCQLTETPFPVRRRFVSRSRAPLAHWRKYFAHYVAAFFSAPEEYWTGRPAHDDPEMLFSRGRNNCRRAWIVEVRFHEPQPLDEVAAWCPSRQYMRLIQKQVSRREPMTPGKSRLLAFLSSRHPLVPGGDLHYCRSIQEWAKGRSL